MHADREATILQFAMFMQARDARPDGLFTGVTWEIIGAPGQDEYLKDAEIYLAAVETLGYAPAGSLGQAATDLAGMEMQLTTAERERDEARAEVAARDAVISEVERWHRGSQHTSLGAILAAAPESVLAARDAEKWWEGVTEQWEHRPIGNRAPESANPYREQVKR